MLMRVAGLASVLPSVCELRGAVCGGCGDGAAAGFGDEVPDAGADVEGEPEPPGPVEDGRGVELPPSFARRFARICARLSSAGLFGRALGSCTLSASDMALSCSCGGGGASVISWSAMLCVCVCVCGGETRILRQKTKEKVARERRTQ